MGIAYSLPKSWQQEKPDHLNQGNPAVFQQYPLRPEVFRPASQRVWLYQKKLVKIVATGNFNVNRNFMLIL